MKRVGLGFLLCVSPNSLLRRICRHSSPFVLKTASDSGNNAIALTLGVTPVPISENSFIPTCPYASGHYTNDQGVGPNSRDLTRSERDPRWLAEPIMHLAGLKRVHLRQTPFRAD